MTPRILTDGKLFRRTNVRRTPPMSSRRLDWDASLTSSKRRREPIPFHGRYQLALLIVRDEINALSRSGGSRKRTHESGTPYRLYANRCRRAGGERCCP